MSKSKANLREQQKTRLDQARGKAERAFFQRLEEAKQREAFLEDDNAELVTKYVPKGGM